MNREHYLQSPLRRGNSQAAILHICQGNYSTKETQGEMIAELNNCPSCYLNNTMDMQLSADTKSWNKEKSGIRSSMFSTTKTMRTFVCLSSPMPVAPIGIANNSRVLPPKSVNKTPV